MVPFWALRHVDLEVMAGQVTGIIGRNGAGKSTLLKLLSRITTPTEGRAEIIGRVGSLLEVGTGFHIDLTGRENVFFSGAVLGMSRAEVRRKLDDIVAFAGVERFIDTPIKHYSSGMQVRLGFAIAAHLEPEVLIVDEVLAVGDEEFQRRCLEKIGDMAAKGLAILLVSHDLVAVRSRCDVAHLFDSGQLVASGPPQEIVDTYVAEVLDEGSGLVTASTWRLADGSGHTLEPMAPLFDPHRHRGGIKPRAHNRHPRYPTRCGRGVGRVDRRRPRTRGIRDPVRHRRAPARGRQLRAHPRPCHT